MASEGERTPKMGAIAEAKLDKLKRLKSSLSGGEMYSSAEEMLINNFRHSSLKTALENGWKEACKNDGLREIKAVMSKIFDMICSSAQDTITAFAMEKGVSVNVKPSDEWMIYPRCEGTALAGATGNTIVLFHALYETRSIQNLFSSTELDQLESIFGAVCTLVKAVGARAFGLEIPRNVLVAIDEGAQKMSNKDDEQKAKFVDGCKDLLEAVGNKACDLYEMKELAEKSPKKTFREANQLLRHLTNGLPAVMTSVDIRIVNAYMDVVKAVFMACKNIDGAVRQFHLDCLQRDNQLPNLAKQYPKHEADFARLLNGMGDDAQFTNHPDKLDTVVRGFAFLLFVLPQYTLLNVLKECISNRLIVPNVLKVLRRLPSITELKLVLGEVERTNSKQRVTLITLMLRHIIIHAECLASRDECTSFIYLVASLTEEPSVVVKGSQERAESSGGKSIEVVDKAVANASEVLLDMVMPWLFVAQGNDCEITLELLCTMFTASQLKRTPIEWNMDADKEDMEESQSFSRFPTAMCLKLLFDVPTATNRQGATISTLALKCLSLLGNRLKEESIVFPEKTREVLSNALNEHVWTLKYAVFTWFATSFDSPKRQIPEGLFKSLSGERQTHFDQISVDFELAPVEGFLRGIFDLGVLCPELAMEFIEEGIAIRPADEHLAMKTALAMTESVTPLTPNDKMASLCGLVSVLVKALDPTIAHNPITFLSRTTLYGLRLVAHLVAIGNAAVLAHTKAINVRQDNDLRVVADKLVLVWCQQAKNHAEREMIDLRRSWRENTPEIREPRVIPSDVKIDRLRTVKVQIAELFSVAVMISRNVDEIPTQLKVLIVTLNEYDTEVNRMGVPPEFTDLDSVSLDSKDQGVVYAIAQPEVEEAEPEGIAEGHRQSAGHASNQTGDLAPAREQSSSLSTDREVVNGSNGVTKNEDLNGSGGMARNDQKGWNKSAATKMEGTSATNELFEVNNAHSGSQDVRNDEQHHHSSLHTYVKNDQRFDHNRDRRSHSNDRNNGNSQWNMNNNRGSPQMGQRYERGAVSNRGGTSRRSDVVDHHHKRDPRDTYRKPSLAPFMGRGGVYDRPSYMGGGSRGPVQRDSRSSRYATRVFSRSRSESSKFQSTSVHNEQRQTITSNDAFEAKTTPVLVLAPAAESLTPNSDSYFAQDPKGKDDGFRHEASGGERTENAVKQPKGREKLERRYCDKFPPLTSKSENNGIRGDGGSGKNKPFKSRNEKQDNDDTWEGYRAKKVSLPEAAIRKEFTARPEDEMYTLNPKPSNSTTTSERPSSGSDWASRRFRLGTTFERFRPGNAISDQVSDVPTGEVLLRHTESTTGDRVDGR